MDIGALLSGISRTSCPWSRKARPKKCDPLQDSIPITCTCTFAVMAVQMWHFRLHAERDRAMQRWNMAPRTRWYPSI
jgi:hypothetical protein